MIGSFIFLNPPQKKRAKSGGKKMAYRRRNGTRRGMTRKTSRRAFEGLRPRRRRRRNVRGTRAGSRRVTARRAYMKTAKPRGRRRRRNPLWRVRETGRFKGSAGARGAHHGDARFRMDSIIRRR